MKSTFSVTYFLKRSAAKKNGKVAIHGRVTVNGDSVQFSPKVEIHPGYWNVKAGIADGKSQEAKDVNTVLESLKATMTKVYRELQEKESNIKALRIKNLALGVESKYKMLSELFKLFLPRIEERVGKSITKVSYERYIRTSNRIIAFMEKKYEKNDIQLNEIDFEFLEDFEMHLKDSMQHNTAMKYMQRFQSMITYAVKKRFITISPFIDYSINFEKTERVFLLMEEVDTIWKKKIENKRVEKIRDLFIFSCYTGLAYIDIFNLEKKNIRKGFDNNLWIFTNRQKTNVSEHVPLLPIPLQILEKYKTHEGDKVFPVPSNQKVNSYLKEIADICYIDKNITFHAARHTFATSVTLNKGVPLETVSKVMGHKNIAMTRHYAEILNPKVSEDMMKLKDLFNIEEQKTTQTEPNSNLFNAFDIKFSVLTIEEKLIFLNLPSSINEERLNKIWDNFPPEAKEQYWEENISRISKITKTLKIKAAS